MSEENSKLSLEETIGLFEFLLGESCPMDITPQDQPCLTPTEAFSVIYYLQEHLHIIPDTYEMCRECESLYDSDSEGVCISELNNTIEYDDEFGNPVCETLPPEKYGLYCDQCRPD